MDHEKPEDSRLTILERRAGDSSRSSGHTEATQDVEIQSELAPELDSSGHELSQHKIRRQRYGESLW